MLEGQDVLNIIDHLNEYYLSCSELLLHLGFSYSY
jgi:hypothetical protein